MAALARLSPPSCENKANASDEEALAALGDEGVLAYIGDSPNIFVEGKITTKLEASPLFQKILEGLLN